MTGSLQIMYSSETVFCYLLFLVLSNNWKGNYVFLKLKVLFYTICIPHRFFEVQRMSALLDTQSHGLIRCCGFQSNEKKFKVLGSGEFHIEELSVCNLYHLLKPIIQYFHFCRALQIHKCYSF